MQTQDLIALAQNAKTASQDLLLIPTAKKNAVLKDLAKSLLKASPQIISENNKDVEAARVKGLSVAMIDRLILNEKRIQVLSQSVLDVAKLKDPVGQVIESYQRDGLKIKRVRIPLGVICMIYESRPNVTIDAAVLCFKSGNAVILRGGSEAFHSSVALVCVMQQVLLKHKIPIGAVTLVPDTERQSMAELLKLDRLIDVVIPRGGEGLMRFIAENSKIPVIKHDKGVCSIFVDASAKLDKAVDVIVNAKTSRPGVCNALETLYVHHKIAKKFLPKLAEALRAKNVEMRGDSEVQKTLSDVRLATEDDFGREYLDLILAIKIVKDVKDAVHNIRQFYSRHTESILTENKKNALYFTQALDSSCVMINTSTRFNDGGELGLGAEIGISTTKLHAYGPMGLAELTIPKFLVESRYKVRV